MAMLPLTCSAHVLKIGEPLPHVAIAETGIAVLEGESVRYQPWNIAELTKGQPHLVQSMAARPVAAEMSKAFTDQFDGSDIHVTKIVNADDAPFGAGMFISGSIEKTKLSNPAIDSVIDDDGEFVAAIQQDEANSLVILLDQSSNVVYFKEGAIGDKEAQKVKSLIAQLADK